MEAYSQSLYLIALVTAPGGDSWRAAHDALRWPPLRFTVALQVNLFAAPLMQPGCWQDSPGLATAILAPEVENWSPSACLASLSLLAAGVEQQSAGQQPQQQQQLTAAEPGSAVAVVADLTPADVDSAWGLLGKAATVGIPRRTLLVEHLLHLQQQAEQQQQQGGRGRAQQQALAAAEAAQTLALQPHLRVIRGVLQELGDAGDAAAPTGRQVELAGDDARWMRIGWDAIALLRQEVWLVSPVTRKQEQAEPMGTVPSCRAGGIDFTFESRRVLGRAWEELPLQEGAPLAEALARLLCKAQHLRLLLQREFKAEEQATASLQQGSGSSATGSGSSSSSRLGAYGAGELMDWLLGCFELWRPGPESMPGQALTAAGGAAACSLLQTCCKLVQHGAQQQQQQQTQEDPPMLFVASWGEAGAQLAKLLTGAALIGTAWGPADQPNQIRHTMAAMASAPRR
jgi:hypothetical protein